ncbi:gamma-glutamylcyclotransferase [Corallococcus sp. M34]|uniref:gamma-glutamylcyclotransferase n=1 Tax=Citreicoccus inhibens TaxID=2849499 RepID=UPI001C231283|nr:gamma-glutamylcyclotransferase [Citreicoccus inhibens]MBU8894840.1 gamma-glutamylcyclotransferase [Citreicoccus inhibens]
MDSHYDQVMKARGAAEGAAPRLYFAYSTILDRAAFEEWRDQHSYGFFDLPAGEVAEAVDVDLVYDFPSRWWGGRVAGLTDVPGRRVYGRLFEIAGKDWPIVQHKEGFVTGMCIERPVRVRVNGRELEATAFVTNPRRASQDGPVSPRFIEALVRGARSAGLPADYIARLSRGE